MQPAFADPIRVAALTVSLARWKGTPFLQHGCQPGVGIDCVRFVREIYRDCGINVGPAEKIPRYAMSWGMHNEHSQLLGWLAEDPDARQHLRRVDEDDPPMPGDIAIVRRARSAHHMGLIGPEQPARVWHVGISGGVMSVDADALRREMRTITTLRLYL